MFYLIGGAPRSGKTILSKKLAKETGIPWISVDTLESIVATYYSVEDLRLLFPKTAMRRESGGGNDLMYSRYTDKEIFEAYAQQAKATWKALEMFVEREERYAHDYILEGHQIHPELAVRISDAFPSKVKAVFLGRSDIETIVKSASGYPGIGDWFTEKTLDAATYPRIAQMLSLYSDYFKNQADARGFSYFDMDVDFHGQLDAAVHFLIK
ncbi:MAG: hypothetical protein V4674_02950 [Patescibacteria group bacterium]